MNVRDDEALGRTIRVQAPRLFILIKRFAPVAAVFYALGGGSGTLLSRVNNEKVTADTLRAVLAPLRDSISRHGDELRVLDAAAREGAVSLASLRVVTDAHTTYLAALMNPWNGPYRGPR